MASRNELVIRGRVVGLTASNYPNDSKFEQKILWLEKNATAQTGTISTTTLTSDATATTAGQTITIGTTAQGGLTYTNVTALTEAKATATYTNASIAVAGETVTVGGITYTYFAAISATVDQPYAVLVGANPTASLANLILAINQGATAGTNYGLGTVAHPRVTGTSSDATTAVVTAKVIGTVGNAYLTSSSSAGAWGGTALTGGLNSVANEVLIGDTGSGAAQLTNLKAAINGAAGAGTTYSTATPPHKLVTAGTLTATQLVITAKDFSIINTDIATTEGADHLSFTSTAMGSGVSKVIAFSGTGEQAPPTGQNSGDIGVSGDLNVVI